MPETTKKKSDFLTNWLKKTIYVDRGPRGQVGFRKIYRKSHLVGGDWNMNGLFSIIWDVILPIDELHHFSRWLKPPTSHT